MRERPLRIFQVLAAAGNKAIPDSRVWCRNLYEPLVEMGHDVVFHRAEEGFKACDDADVRGRFSQQLLDRFRRCHSEHAFDLVFTYLRDGMIEPRVIDDIRAHSVPTVNFSCNNVHQFDVVEKLSPHFDLNLHAERHVDEKFAKIGASALWWPMASNPRYFKPYDLKRTIDASFVGANYATRATHIRYLLESGINVYAFGPKWQCVARTRMRARFKSLLYRFRAATQISSEKRRRAKAEAKDFELRNSMGAAFPKNMHQPISDQELIELYSRSKISLGFLDVFDQNDPSREIVSHIHLREFEAPMCGALYLTGASDELAEAFEPGKEMLVYENQEELLEKVRWALQHPDETEKIRQAGHRRALADHSYQRRFKDLFRVLGLG